MIATLGGRFGGYGLFLSQSHNWWLRSTVFKVVIWGLFLLGLLLTLLARSRQWSGWKAWPGYALLILAPLWLIAGLITGVAQIGRGRPVFVYNMLDLERFSWPGPSLSAGKHTSSSTSNTTGPAQAKVAPACCRSMARKSIARRLSIPFRFSCAIDETFDIGVDTRSPVDFSYDLPFRFNGKIDKLTYNLGPSQMTAEDQKKAQEMVASANN